MAPRSVRTAVIPAAGLGTRFQPAGKAVPKPMVTLVDKPAIQWVVEEAVAAGIEHVVIVIGRGQSSIEDHFDRSPELEAALAGSASKAAILRSVQAISELAHFSFVRQGSPKGLGHAVNVAHHAVGDEPFAVLLPDDVMRPGSRVLAEMVDRVGAEGRSVVALKQVVGDAISAYGCAAVEGGGAWPKVLDLVEKPAAADAPSDLAIMGRYVFTPAIFDALDRVQPGALGELQLTDGIKLLAQEEGVDGHVFDEGRFDVGNKLDYLTATVALGLEHPELGEAFGVAVAALVRDRGLV